VSSWREKTVLSRNFIFTPFPLLFQCETGEEEDGRWSSRGATLRKITIDQSGSNTAAITRYNKTPKTAIIIRHSKDLNNIVEQDHRMVKRITRPRLGFKSFWAACGTIAGIEVRPAIRRGQLLTPGNSPQSPVEQFYASAAEVTNRDHLTRLLLKVATKPFSPPV
jgi:DDE superfamily endonuclease